MYLQIKSKIINEPIINILKQVKSEIRSNKLSSIIDKGDNVLITCPIHKNGCETHPSCQVYCGDSPNVEYGTVHCFTCGYTASLSQLITDCFDEKDKSFGDEWLVERFGNCFIEKKLNIDSPITLSDNKKDILDEKILDKFNYIHPYMYKRKLTDYVINKFKIGFDKFTNCITFPVWDENNNLVMITKRSVIDKHFYIDENKSKPVYLYNFIKNENITTVYLCESQINALTLWSWGYPAIALIGTGSSEQYNILNRSGIRNYILCFDGDEAGDKGITRFKKNIKDDVIISIKEIPRGKDVNDLSKEAFDNLKII